MKKLISILLIFPLGMLAQDAKLALQVGKYTNKDLLPDADLQGFANSELKLLLEGKESADYFIDSYEIKIIDKKKGGTGAFQSGKINARDKKTFTLSCKQAILKSLKDQQILLTNINIIHFGMGDDVSYVQAPDISIIRVSVSAKNDNAPSTAKQINYEGKLLMGAEAKEPLVNKKVILEDDKNTELQNTVTDKYGDFSFKSVEASKSYHVKVDANGPKIKDGQLYIAKQNGTIINSLKKSGNFYVYELLPAELSTLKKEKEEDTELKLADFSSSDKTELTVLENIYYVSNSTENNTETIIKLDKVSEVMKKNKAIKLAISSHTDSKGDDNSNLVLSEKRAQVVLDYFVRKGIEKHRLSAKGYGETQIKNRCKNGVDCSEKEQELNRRTEFKFTK